MKTFYPPNRIIKSQIFLSLHRRLRVQDVAQPLTTSNSKFITHQPINNKMIPKQLSNNPFNNTQEEWSHANTCPKPATIITITGIIKVLNRPVHNKPQAVMAVVKISDRNSRTDIIILRENIITKEVGSKRDLVAREAEVEEILE